MNIFVTGGSGFIGGHLIRLLLQRGETVHLLCRAPFRTAPNQPGRLVPHQGDLLDAKALREAMRGCEQVFHLAGYARNWAPDPSIYFDINVRGTRSVLHAAAKVGVKRIVVTSSVLALGFSNGHPFTEADVTKLPLPTPYAESKRAAERAAIRFSRHGSEVVVVNPTRVYGPGLMTEGNSVTRMIRLHLAGRWPLILGDGSAIGNYCHVRDVADGHVRAMQHGTPGERYILGGENVSFNTLFEEIRRVSGESHHLFRLPGQMATYFSRCEELRASYLGGHPTITPGWVRTFLMNGEYSSAKACREIGYTITPLARGLQETIDWLRHSEQEVL